ncbi:G1 family glutamic endopeptidase [Saccharothrix obliqua]|uniref:G1 family glutamic endopeptidase n=1 Tax=Saccharothrix obliqua TaxID=2861747 RepID=UPI001C601692|nr:G1 family glutamic endopeptidase [Saccharothrix obliqua]MBW4717800.1 hypothetical protein [Saccharothrix obliqua]
MRRTTALAAALLATTLTTPPARAAIDPRDFGIWAGYVARNDSRPTHFFGSVYAEWTVPPVTCKHSKDLYAAWVGLGGGTPTDDWLVQGGTVTDCKTPDGRPRHYAFYEAVRPQGTPSPPVRVRNAVDTNDRIVASVSYDRRTTWVVTVSNTTKGWQFSKTYDNLEVGPSSAEAVVESPAHNYPDFGNVSFQSVAVDGLPISRANPEKWRAFDSKDMLIEAEPGSIATTPAGKDGFPVFWRRE